MSITQKVKNIRLILNLPLTMMSIFGQIIIIPTRMDENGNQAICQAPVEAVKGIPILNLWGSNDTGDIQKKIYKNF